MNPQEFSLHDLLGKLQRFCDRKYLNNAHLLWIGQIRDIQIAQHLDIVSSPEYLSL